jgi:hypothetical protein
LKGRLSPYELFYHLSFALRVTFVGKEPHITNVRISSTSDKTNLVDKWLHPNMTMDKVQQICGTIEELKYRNESNFFLYLLFEYFRFELRLRYFPQSIDALSHDKPTFGYFYEQVDH